MFPYGNIYIYKKLKINYKIKNLSKIAYIEKMNPTTEFPSVCSESNLLKNYLKIHFLNFLYKNHSSLLSCKKKAIDYKTQSNRMLFKSLTVNLK